MSNMNPGTGCGTGTESKSDACTATMTCATCDVNAITSPGCYVCHWDGSLLRVDESCFTVSGCMSFSLTCNQPMSVTCVSDDPNASMEACRTAARALNLCCNF